VTNSSASGLAERRPRAAGAVVDALAPDALARGTRAHVVPRSLTATGALLVAASAALWTAAVGWLAVWRHHEFLSHRYDLGNMVQAVWSSANGRLLEVTDGHTGEQVTRLAGHVDPILVLFVPLWWLHPEPEVLIVGQAAALAAGLYPVIRLALKHTGSRVLAALLGAWYLAFPWMLWNAVNDVHPVTLAIPLLLYAIWFLDEHHLGRFALVAALALLCGELVGLTLAALGVWYALAHGRPRVGAAIALAGTAWTALCLLVIVPHFNDGRSSRFYSLFESVGGSPTGLLKTLFTDPGVVLAEITTSADATYVLLLLVPTAFLALGQPLLAAVALPQLGVNLLSEQDSSTGPTFQYVAPILPALLVATAVMVGRLDLRLRRLAMPLLLAGALMCLVAIPPKPGGQYYVFDETETAARIRAMRDALEHVPENASLMTTNRLGGHLSARAVIHVFPTQRGARWAVLDVRDAWLVRETQVDEPRFRALLSSFERDPAWRLVFDREDVRVYRRIS
jgi:uncharacterized membrane protein